MASTTRRSLDTVRYRLQRLKTTSLTENVYSQNETTTNHTIFDLVLVGLGTIFPISLFVLSGHAAKDLAGPSSILSILFAALAAALSGLSYSELRARVYRLQASAYEYTYRVVGEAAAFTIGWLLLLHHITCTATTARAITQNLDYLLNSRISNFTITHLGDIPALGSYLDFAAFLVGLLTMIAVVVDISLEGRKVRLASLVLSTVVILFVLVVGLYHLDFHHWQNVSGFFPQGIGGVLAAATVFTYAFWGSESILRSCDLNSRGVRRPVMTSILIVHILTMVVLIFTLSAITLLTDTWSTDTPFPEGFTSAGIPWVRYVICPVAILVLGTVLLYHYKHSVRSVCCLASDGLLPSAFSDKNSRTDTPVVTIIAVGVVSSLCALVFSVSNLIQVLPIPIVLIQVTTCIVTICFHYKPESNETEQRTSTKRKRKRKRNVQSQSNGSVSAGAGAEATGYGATVSIKEDASQTDTAEFAPGHFERMIGQSSPVRTAPNNNNNSQDMSSSDTDIDDIVEEYHHERCVRHLTENTSPAEYRKRSTVTSFRRVRLALGTFLCAAVLMGLLVGRLEYKLGEHNIGVVLLLVTSLLGMIASVIVILRQPRDSIQPYTVMMYVHHVPWTPLVALIMNVMMCCALGFYPSLATVLWLLTGMLVYMFYGMTHSQEAMYPDHYPEEHRGLIYQSGSASGFASRQQHSTVEAPLVTDHTEMYGTDREDDQLLDCT